jgi:dephospho-CoA kinase
MKIGVTGGIGSGKTTVSRIFQSLGIPVYFADARAKQLILKDQTLRNGYIRLFGSDVYTYDGLLNRKLIADRIFNNPKLLKEVNSLVHPVVRKDFDRWCMGQTAPFVIQEAAVLIEGGGYKLMDRVVLVSAPEELRIKRVTSRDGSTRELVEQRMKNQWPTDRLREFCDFEVLADDKQLVTPQVLRIHKELTE